MQEGDTIYCQLHKEFWYECSGLVQNISIKLSTVLTVSVLGHPRQFYLIILIITIIITVLHISW